MAEERLALIAAIIVAALFAAFFPFDTANAQSPSIPKATDSCLLLPAFCELRGETLNTETCACVRPAGRTDTCLLQPAFCELRGETLNTETCDCVRPAGRPGACLLQPAFCELQGQSLNSESCACVRSGGENVLPRGSENSQKSRR
jgi:hypothetical protein